jgi:hypothetical protein
MIRLAHGLAMGELSCNLALGTTVQSVLPELTPPTYYSHQPVFSSLSFFIKNTGLVLKHFLHRKLKFRRFSTFCRDLCEEKKSLAIAKLF